MNTQETEQREYPSPNNPKVLTLQGLFIISLGKWYYFVISVFAVLFVAFLYLASTPPSYRSSACLIIKQDRRTGNSGLENTTVNFSNMGNLFTQQTNVYNEIIAFRSPTLMTDVVNNLGLRAEYTVSHRLYQKVLYGNSLPVQLSPVDFPTDKSFSLKINYKDKNSVEICNITTVIAGKKMEFPEKITLAYHDTVDTPVGKITASPGLQYFDNPVPFPTISLTYMSLAAATGRFSGGLNVSLTDKEGTAITLSHSDRSPERARDIVSSLISVYNERWVGDRSQIAKSTSKFINERLVLLEQELGEVDSDISAFKSHNLIVDPIVAGDVYFNQANRVQNELAEMENRLNMAQYVRSYMESSVSNNQLLPANSGIDNSGIEAQIAEYNMLQLKRNRLAENSSRESPVVQQLDLTLADTRAAILASIDNFIVTIQTQINSLQKISETNRSRITASPKQAEYLTDIQRQQKVKESLYLYLLQKREENELSQAFTAYNTRLLTAPSFSGAPVSPQKSRILLVAFLLGLAIPLGWIYLKETTNTKVRGRKDIENLKAPYIGEIPRFVRKHKHGIRGTIHELIHKKPMNVRVVKPHNRNIVNEAFRVVRTNMEFMCGKEPGTVIQTTSFNVGSGKSFISVNLATAFALNKNRVCLVDMDIRKASLSDVFGHFDKGVSDYLAEKTDDIKSLIVKDSMVDTLDILPVGSIPPNPAELLYSERLGKLIEYLKKNYDLIFIDCPPAEIVADTSIITRHVDRTLFVIRAGLLEREMLPDLDKFYDENRYTRMMVLLNSTETKSIYGYGYGYSGAGFYTATEKLYQK